MDKLKVLEYEINTKIINQEDYVSLTDIAKKVNEDEPRFVIQNWMRNKDTIDYLGLWESIYNPNFNRMGFEAVENESGRNRFTMSPTKWINSVNSIGMVTKAGKHGGGTYAHFDIAMEFASWISPEFKLYIVTEFKRMKEKEQRGLGWNLKRTLSKINITSKKTNNKLKMDDLLVRSAIGYGLIFDLISILLLKLCDMNAYFKYSNILNYFESGILFACVLLILFRKDNRGLHDLIANTKVVYLNEGVKNENRDSE